MEIKKGKYYIFASVLPEDKGTTLVKNNYIVDKFTVNFNSNANVSSFKNVTNVLTDAIKSDIVSSTIYDYSCRKAVSATLKDRKLQSDVIKPKISIGNSFDEIGFGFISINVDIKSTSSLSMKISPA